LYDDAAVIDIAVDQVGRREHDRIRFRIGRRGGRPQHSRHDRQRIGGGEIRARYQSERGRSRARRQRRRDGEDAAVRRADRCGKAVAEAAVDQQVSGRAQRQHHRLAVVAVSVQIDSGVGAGWILQEREGAAAVQLDPGHQVEG
ncbi:hypothetical protein CEE75_14090, partial [Lactobacillus crispatus]